MGRLRVVTIPDIEPVAEYTKEKIKNLRRRYPAWMNTKSIGGQYIEEGI